MSENGRRQFLKLMSASAVAAAFPGSIARALAIPASQRRGSIKDVEHIVILTQENRSFDHYFGTLNGVRGYADPRAVQLSSGRPVWYQPDGAGGYVLPFRPQVPNVGGAYLPDPPHGWNDGHQAWNEGRCDGWVPAKGASTMAYLTRQDLPYHYALADAFTLCDAYYCSLMGPTDPNRYHLWTGWCGNDGSGGGPVITNAEAGYDWMTFPERLQQAGIGWKIYQDTGVGLDAAGYWGWTENAFIGNYGDNSLLYFHQYQNAAPGTPLAVGAKTGTNIAAGGTLFDIFRADVEAGRLPQVSYIAAPEAYSEHPNWPANFGAWYISQILDILTANPEIWSKTVLLINYDEDGGFFDHMVAPTPPQSPAQGLSTVATTNEIFPGDAAHPAGPYGLGVRVPMLVVSPWSKGGYVNSQVFDHTSVIRFIEARFADEHPEIVETNITPWRRAVAGDLTSAFDFKKPNAAVISLPSTTALAPGDQQRHPNDTVVPPGTQAMPAQEHGVRPARALPYALEARGELVLAERALQIHFENTGVQGAVFQVRSGASAEAPRSYTVEAGRRLSDRWDIVTEYDCQVHGPNGFLRAFKGDLSAARPALIEVHARYVGGGLALEIASLDTRRLHLELRDRYTGDITGIELGAGRIVRRHCALARSAGWYDFELTTRQDPAFLRQLAGHVETGRDGITDPALGGVLPRREAEAG